MKNKKNKQKAVPFNGIGKTIAIKNMAINPETKYMDPEAEVAFMAGEYLFEFSRVKNSLYVSFGHEENDFVDTREEGKEIKITGQETMPELVSLVWDTYVERILYLSSLNRMTEEKEMRLIKIYGPVNVFEAQNMDDIDVRDYDFIIIPEKEVGAMTSTVLSAAVRGLKKLELEQAPFEGHIMIRVTNETLTLESFLR